MTWFYANWPSLSLGLNWTSFFMDQLDTYINHC